MKLFVFTSHDKWERAKTLTIGIPEDWYTTITDWYADDTEYNRFIITPDTTYKVIAPDSYLTHKTISNTLLCVKMS